MLASLSDLLPDVVTAFLELRPGRGARLLTAHVARLDCASAEFEHLKEFGTLAEEISKIRIGYLLRQQAMRAAAQIHAPFNWPTLDDLDRHGRGGTLKLGTMMKAVQADLAMLKHALKLYKAGRRHKVSSGTIARLSLVNPRPIDVQFSLLNVSSAPVEAARFAHLDIEQRARVQLAFWRIQHGAALEDVLEHVVGRMEEVIARLEVGLKARKSRHDGKTIVGNMDRANAGIRLFFAVEEAVAWTASRVEHSKEAREDSKWDANRSRHDSAIATATQTAARSQDRRLHIATPRHQHENAFAITHLFTAYRLAFLQDNEALPIKLRTVIDPSTGNKQRVKTYDHAQRISGHRYSFREQWRAFTDVRLAKRKWLGPKPTNAELSVAKQVDLVARRDANQIRSHSLRHAPRDTFTLRDALRAGIIRGLTAA